MDLTVGYYRLKAENTSIPKRIGKAVDFTAKYHIVPELDIRPGLADVDAIVRERMGDRPCGWPWCL